PPLSPLVPYTTLFRSSALRYAVTGELIIEVGMDPFQPHHVRFEIFGSALQQAGETFLPFDTNHKTKPENEGNLHIARQLVEQIRSEEHTSELQSRFDL